MELQKPIQLQTFRFEVEAKMVCTWNIQPHGCWSSCRKASLNFSHTKLVHVWLKWWSRDRVSGTYLDLTMSLIHGLFLRLLVFKYEKYWNIKVDSKLQVVDQLCIIFLLRNYVWYFFIYFRRRIQSGHWHVNPLLQCLFFLSYYSNLFLWYTCLNYHILFPTMLFDWTIEPFKYTLYLKRVRLVWWISDN